jgi:hypothetical protein
MLASTSAQAQTQTAAAPGGDRNEAGVMKVMQQWLDALQTRDMKTLALILGEEWTDNSRVGLIYTRKDFFAGPPIKTPPASALTAPATYLSRRFENVRVRMYGDAAVVTGTVGNDTSVAESSVNGLPRTIFTDVLVWREGRWQAVTSQETAIPGKANGN